MDIVIRESHLEEAATVHNKIPEFEQHELAYFYQRCGGREKFVLAAHAREESVGYLIAYEYDNSLYCWLVGVLPDFRKNGIMKGMMDYMFSWAKLRGYKKVTIKTRNKRREMLNYLVKNGFNLIKVIRVENPVENRILLEKNLS